MANEETNRNLALWPTQLGSLAVASMFLWRQTSQMDKWFIAICSLKLLVHMLHQHSQMATMCSALVSCNGFVQYTAAAQPAFIGWFTFIFLIISYSWAALWIKMCELNFAKQVLETVVIANGSYCGKLPGTTVLKQSMSQCYLTLQI